MCEELLQGVKEDLFHLITTHAAKNSFDFKDFVETWKDLKFYYIFSGRHELDEMRFFMEHILMIAKDMFLRTGNIADVERAAAIFLLHDLYVNQPLVERVKIRIELEELQLMNKFATRMKSAGNRDVTFAFYSLMRKDAFHYVYSYWIRTAEKNHVNVREHLRQKVKPEKIHTKINVTEMLDELGFNVDSWNHLEALYNLDITELKGRGTSTEIEKIKEHNFLTEFNSKVQSVEPPTVIKEQRRKRMRFDKLLQHGIPSTSKEISPEPEVIESKISLPKLYYSSDEETSEHSSNDLMEEFKPSTSSKIKAELYEELTQDEILKEE